MVFAEREMTHQGAALQTYQNELVKSLEEWKARKAGLQHQIEAESLEASPAGESSEVQDTQAHQAESAPDL